MVKECNYPPSKNHRQYYTFTSMDTIQGSKFHSSSSSTNIGLLALDLLSRLGNRTGDIWRWVTEGYRISQDVFPANSISTVKVT